MLISDTIYFDHNASTPPDASVVEEMLPFFAESFANPHSVDHALGWRAARAIERASMRIAALFGCDADEVIFTSGATEANNLAVLGTLGGTTGDRRRIITTAIEHKSVLSIGRVLEAQGCCVDFATVDREGRIDDLKLKEMLDDDVLLVSFAAVNSEIGTLQPIAEISEHVAAVGALLHIDAAQAPLAMSVYGLLDLCDFASVSAHKMYGPQGVGALLVRRESQRHLAPVIHGGGQQNGLRSGTLPLALCAGFGKAAELLGDEHDQRRAREALAGVRNLLFETLKSEVPGLVLNGPSLSGARHPGNLNVRLPGCEAQDILTLVQPHLAASTGSACASGIPEPSHVLTGIGQSRTEAAAGLRFGVGRYSTPDQARQAATMIGDAIRSFASESLAE
ncbi:cysteine desulfurase family protein [Pannonibacter phragmitetus]|uniref:cysteine desulfurase family protein n=1 Tax=Pannonibacter phragmitetus TaxID=121719 RepID=UPI000E65FBC7|nr:cysteine desulfurase family protein [Pannonibacter phragmitetus]